jgi:hypothetical protein
LLQALMKSLLILENEAAPYLTRVVTQLNERLKFAVQEYNSTQNQVNDKTFLYHRNIFESLCAAIRIVFIRMDASIRMDTFENLLFPVFQDIILQKNEGKLKYTSASRSHALPLTALINTLLFS